MKFQITYKATGEVAKFKSNQWKDFEAEVWDILLWVSKYPNTENDYEFVVDNKVVSLDLAQKAATFARKEWEAKRATTHKQITRRKQGTQGNFKNNFETVWVKIW